jgi:hypothetical protein
MKRIDVIPRRASCGEFLLSATVAFRALLLSHQLRQLRKVRRA